MATLDLSQSQPGLAPSSIRTRPTVWQALARHRVGAVGMLFLLLLVLMALFAPQLATHDPTVVSASDRLKPPGTEFLLGTDKLGRDLFSRIVYGARVSLTIGLVSVSIAATGGVLLGLIAGSYRGKVDTVCVWFIDTLMAMPEILLAISIVFALGPGLYQVMIAVGIASVPVFARVVRGKVLQVREEPYVEAAYAVGCTRLHTIARHILPNIVAPLIVMMTIRVASAILAAAGLSFLGLGAQPPTPEWGTMVNAGRDTLRTAWWISTFPGLMIAITVIVLNLLGDALRDILDPHFE